MRWAAPADLSIRQEGTEVLLDGTRIDRFIQRGSTHCLQQLMDYKQWRDHGTSTAVYALLSSLHVIGVAGRLRRRQGISWIRSFRHFLLVVVRK